jgi:hypothetical protein
MSMNGSFVEHGEQGEKLEQQTEAINIAKPHLAVHVERSIALRT